jgi:hypothetical protein
MFRLRQELQTALELLALLKKREEIKMQLTKVSCARISHALDNPASLVSLLYYDGKPIPSIKTKIRRATPTKPKSHVGNGAASMDRNRSLKRNGYGSFAEGEPEHRRKRRKTVTPREEELAKPDWEPQYPKRQRSRATQKYFGPSPEEDEPKLPKPRRPQILFRGPEQKELRRALEGDFLRGTETNFIEPEPDILVPTELVPEENVTNSPQKVKTRKRTLRQITETYEDEGGELEDKYVWCTLLPCPGGNKHQNSSSNLSAVVLPHKGEDPYIGRRRVGRGGRVWWDLYRIQHRTTINEGEGIAEVSGAEDGRGQQGFGMEPTEPSEPQPTEPTEPVAPTEPLEHTEPLEPKETDSQPELQPPTPSPNPEEQISNVNSNSQWNVMYSWGLF